MREIRSTHEGEIQWPTDRIPENLKVKPFRDTGLGRLPTEIRQMIYKNLLASPPAYAGHDIYATAKSSSCQSPIPLATFVDLKGSSLAILRTCRQVHFEAFPVFYANKSYYVAEALDIVTMLRHRSYLRAKPTLFRLDTITSLCLRNIVVYKPRWRATDIEHLISRHGVTNRETLQAEQIPVIRSELSYLDFRDMKSLRTICLCVLAGQEVYGLHFLFNMKGFGRGVIKFIDDFHWSIRSQNVSADDWKLQYPGFCHDFYEIGMSFKLTRHKGLVSQRKHLEERSRASDSTKGIECWIEIDIGPRLYEDTGQHLEEIAQHNKETMQNCLNSTDPVPSQVSESQEKMPAEGANELLPKHEPNGSTNHLQGLRRDQGDDPQLQSRWDGGSQHLQVRQNRQNDDTKPNKEPTQGSS